MDRITELRGKRMTLAEQARTLRERADRSEEDNRQYDDLLGQIEQIDTEIEREERHLRSEANDADYMRRHGGANPGSGGSQPPASSANPNPESRDAAGRELVTFRARSPQPGSRGLRELADQVAYRDPEFLRFMGQLRNQVVPSGNYTLRAFQADNDPEGGYLVRPELFVARLIQAVDDQVFIRQGATVMQVMDAASMGVPSLDTDVADADWTVELGTGNEETTMRLGKRSLAPHPLAKRIKLSKTLLRLAALSAEDIVIQRLAYKFGLTQEKAFLTGSGAGQPLGVFTASADGISTGRDVSTGNTTTEITPDGLIEAKYTLKAAYWPNARWLFHRTGMKQVAKAKDGEGRYMWEPSIRDGEPDRLLGHPIWVSEHAPSTFTTGQYVGMFGDFSNYWIADALSMEMQRLVELYAETNQIGFIGRVECDGMPVLEEAFVRVKLA